MPERDRERRHSDGGDGGGEVFSNPLPPSMAMFENEEDNPNAQPMTNDDFRKLMMTPRAPKMGQEAMTDRTPKTPSKLSPEEEEDPAVRRRKKKSYYAKLKRQEEERQKELNEKYRDRAQERREGQNHDYDQTELISTTADYRAVAPDAKSGESYAERRKQLIQESKYLGGDMEHTHLVKGLDYALLEKVRAEICSKEQEDIEMEIMADKPEKEEPDPEETILFRSRLGRNIFRTVFKRFGMQRNELFLPGRMAYVVDLEDYVTETDIPTTIVRSKADCPSLESTTTLTSNDIVINKLTQILPYLRQGRRETKKLKKKEKGKTKEEEKPKETDMGVYEEMDEYVPSYNRANKEKERGKDRDRERDRDRDRDRRDRRDRDRDRHDRDRDRHERSDRNRDRDRHDRHREDKGDRKRSYFEKPSEEDDQREPNKPPTSAKDMVRSINEKFSKGWAPADLEREATLRTGSDPSTSSEIPRNPDEKEKRMKKIRNSLNTDSYAECYPGMAESYDAIEDSDDEVDYTKMDQGNKKGPIGRWDFDTQEEYSDYMSNKEALPKAAFQYGVKMADGRKTRRTGPKDEKAQLDREWQKIQNIINKRKAMGSEGEPQRKSSKY